METEFKVGQKVHWYNSYGVYIGIVTIVGIDTEMYSSGKIAYYVSPNDSHWCPVGIGEGYSDSRFFPVSDKVYYSPIYESPKVFKWRNQ